MLRNWAKNVNRDIAPNLDEPLTNAWVRARMEGRYNLLQSEKETWEATRKEWEI